MDVWLVTSYGAVRLPERLSAVPTPMPATARFTPAFLPALCVADWDVTSGWCESEPDVTMGTSVDPLLVTSGLCVALCDVTSGWSVTLTDVTRGALAWL